MNPYIHYFSFHAVLLMSGMLIWTWWYLSNGIKSAVYIYISTRGDLPVWLVVWVFAYCIPLWPITALLAWENRLKEKKEHPVDYAKRVLQNRLNEHEDLYTVYRRWVEMGKPEKYAPQVGDMNEENANRVKEKIEELQYAINKLEE